MRSYIDNGIEYNSATYRKVIGEVRRQVTQKRLEYLSHDRATRLQQDFCKANNLDTALLVPNRRYERQFCDRNPNNCSVMVKVTYDAVSFLFPGDAEHEAEERYLEDFEVRSQLASKVLKVSHHGSDTSSGPDFLQAVSPSWMEERHRDKQRVQAPKTFYGQKPAGLCR